MKTVGQALEIALRVRPDQAKRVTRYSFERNALSPGLADQQARSLIRHFEKPLGDADVDHHHAWRELRRHAKGRQRRMAVGLRRGAFRKTKFGERFGRHQRFSGRRDEGLQACASDRRRIADFRRQGDGFDTEQAEGSPADLNAAFENGRYGPAGAAQVDEELLREGCAVASDQRRRPDAAKGGRGAIVTAARLKVQCLHAAP